MVAQDQAGLRDGDCLRLANLRLVLALSSFCNELGAGLEVLTLRCRLGLYLFFGLIRCNHGRLRSNVRLFLLGSGGVSAIRVVSTVKMHEIESFQYSCDTWTHDWSIRFHATVLGRFFGTRCENQYYTPRNHCSPELRDCSEFVIQCYKIFYWQITSAIHPHESRSQ